VAEKPDGWTPISDHAAAGYVAEVRRFEDGLNSPKLS
jgi:hypothetical protein